MKFQLPPKRFDDPSDPKYDPIRHLSWFWKLAKRREKLKFLKQANQDMICNKKLQKDAARNFGLDERELRDYISFVNHEPRMVGGSVGAAYQHASDLAYLIYCRAGGLFSFTKCLERAAPDYGIKPRHLTELWETDPTFYPQGCK